MLAATNVLCWARCALDPRGQPALCIINPAAGAWAGRRHRSAILAALQAIGFDLVVADTQWPGHAVDMTADRGGEFPIVIAVGGDGTASEVVNGLVGAGHDPLFAMIHVGSGADFALNLGVRDREQALLALTHGAERRVDVGRIELETPLGRTTRHFALTTGTGFSPRVIARATLGVKRLLGSHTYNAAAVLAAMGYRPPLMRWSLDGETGEGRVFNVVVANAERESGGAVMSPGARLDDGHLWVTIARETSALRGLWRMRHIFDGSYVKQPGVTYRQAAEVHLESDPPVGVQVDGDVPGRTPARFGILPGRLRVLVPEHSQGSDR